MTGSSRGIGRAIAEAFLREGARVAISGRTREDLDWTFSELKARWGPERVLAHQGDLTRDDAIRKYLETIDRHWNGVDILVANLGSGRGKAGWESDREEWNRLLELNLIASSLLASSAVPLMRLRGGGSITFISSLAGTEAVPAPVPYSCAKASLIALSKSLSRLLAPENIRVNAVAPGNILFPGGVWQRKLDEDPDRVTAYIDAEVPMKRMGTPEEVANAVVFLASARASFITGACLLVDGGQARGW
ncbi:MAG: SDR family oxidoreductase [Nitrospirae bacterium]|nr:SDR family oxidoreductase [Nitrospirota bacterium]